MDGHVDSYYFFFKCLLLSFSYFLATSFLWLMLGIIFLRTAISILSALSVCFNDHLLVTWQLKISTVDTKYVTQGLFNLTTHCTADMFSHLET